MTGGAMLDKAAWRELLLARRRAVPEAVRDAEARRLAQGAVAACRLAEVRALLPRETPGTVCTYLPFGHEPGSPAMAEALRAGGQRVLLPRFAPGSGGSGTPDWAVFEGTESLVDGPFGLRQPSGPALGSAACAEAALVLVPALAVDRKGTRLGRGAGWYDRALICARPGAVLLAVIRDEELVQALPTEPHDVPMTGALTPSTGPRTFRPPLH